MNNQLFPLYLILNYEILKVHKENYVSSPKYSFTRLIYRPETMYKYEIFRDTNLKDENIPEYFRFTSYEGFFPITETEEVDTDIAWYFNYLMKIAKKPVYMTNALCRSLTSSEENIKAFNEELKKHNIGFIACPNIRYK